MTDIQNTIDFTGSLKILLVLTSALFAVAQYYDTRQKNIVRDLHSRLRKIQFHKDYETDPVMKRIKQWWESIRNEEARDNQWAIYSLFGIFLCITVIFTAGIGAKILGNGFTDTFNAWALLITSIVLTFIGIGLLVSLVKMIRQRDDLVGVAEKLEEIYESANSSEKTNKKKKTP